MNIKSSWQEKEWIEVRIPGENSALLFVIDTAIGKINSMLPDLPKEIKTWCRNNKIKVSPNRPSLIANNLRGKDTFVRWLSIYHRLERGVELQGVRCFIQNPEKAILFKMRWL